MGLDRSDVLALSAIIVSLIALVSTIGQIVQQYLGTSEGYRRCRTSVMGLWGHSTRRRFDWSDMRFEVFFETPIFFKAQPDPRRDIDEINERDNSYKRSSTILPTSEKEEGQQTADHERASWVTLLEVLQRHEKFSRRWNNKTLTDSEIFHRREPPEYTLGIYIQRMIQSWSFVPAGVVKPYADTTISHLIEIVAMLDMHLVAFDQASGNVAAEGNYMVVTSALVPGLGLLVEFNVASGRVLTNVSKRTIPTEELKNLSFGHVPPIFAADRTSSNLRLGSRDEVMETF